MPRLSPEEIREMLQRGQEEWETGAKDYAVRYGDKQVPADTYLFRVQRLALSSTRAGNPRIMRNLVIHEGPYKGYPVFDSIQLSGSMLSASMQEIVLMGGVIPEELSKIVDVIDEITAIGPICKGVLTYSEFNGRPWANVTLTELVAAGNRAAALPGGATTTPAKTRSKARAPDADSTEVRLRGVLMGGDFGVEPGDDIETMKQRFVDAGYYVRNEYNEAELEVLSEVGLDAYLTAETSTEDPDVTDQIIRLDGDLSVEGDGGDKDQEPTNVDKVKTRKKKNVVASGDDVTAAELRKFLKAWDIDVPARASVETLTEITTGNTFDKAAADDEDRRILKSLGLTRLLK